MFASIFQSDLQRLKSGKLSPDKAIRSALKQLENKTLPTMLVDQERRLLVEALMLLPEDMFVPCIIVKPEIIHHIIPAATTPIIERLHFAYLIAEQANSNKENQQLWPCINRLRAKLTDLAIYYGTPNERCPAWHQYWWDEITAQFLEGHLEIDFCPHCGMDASLSELELSERQPHNWMEDRRIWSIICCECHAVLQKFAADAGGRINLRPIPKN